MIYLDNHATTRCDPRVVEAMLPWFAEQYGNASSVGHAAGDAAREAVDGARSSIAGAVGAAADEIVFTSGATESNNLAIRGAFERKRRRGDHLVSVTTEHRAVLDPLERLARRGAEVTLLDVAPHGSADAGRVDPTDIAAAIRDDTCLVSVMLANNEVGTIQPIAEIAAVCHERGVLLHSDATQAVGKLPVDADTLGVDLMSFTAHKLYGPKGIGALFIRGRDRVARIDPQITGGGQQRGRRGGTLNVPGIVGFAAAVELCLAELPTEPARLGRLRDRLWGQLQGGCDGLELCGPPLDRPERRLPHNLTVLCPGLDGEAVLMGLDGVAISSGAACSSDEPGASHVLQALGLPEDRARGSLRFGLGRFTTEADIDQAAAEVLRSIAQLQGLAGEGPA